MGLRGAWQRIRTQERPYNLLVVSDLHLGCELRARGPVQPSERSRGVDRELVRFLDHYSANREEGRPWRLVLNGDIVDFIAVTVTPAADEETPFTIRPEERQYGLAPEEQKCVWKLRRVAQRHTEVFDALGRFLLAGNSIHIVRGNHDAEFHWPAVQAELRRILVERTPGLAWRVAQRLVRFHAWFYLEPGFFFVEHGNAHDRYCVQTGFFEPTGGAVAAQEMDLPMSSLVLRFFVNKYAEQEDLDHCDTWGVPEYFKWVWKAGNPLRIAADYFMMVFRVIYPIAKQSLRLSRMAARAARRAMGEQQRTRHVRGMLARFSEASESQAQKLLELASTPAEQSLFDSAQLFFLDRMLLALISLGAAAFAVHESTSFWAKFLGIGVVAMVFAGLNAVLSRQRKTDAHPQLMQAARRVQQIFDVRYVVMGHSHRAVSEPIGASARYFNLGSWTTVRGDEGFPHVIVRGKRAELVRWKGPLNPTAEFEPQQPALVAPEKAPVLVPVPAARTA